MTDEFFNKRVYVGTYEPIFRFVEFGDESNYWIKLKYYVNRDDYQTVRQSRGAALDFGLENLDGEPIFGDVPAEHLAALKSRGYVLGAQSPEPANEEGDLLLVTETYVYAPPKTYVLPDSDVVPIWGVEDTDYATKSSIIMGVNAGNVWANQFYRNTVMAVSNPAAFKTGDWVIAHFSCAFGFKHFVIGVIWFYGALAESIRPLRIVRKWGKYVELDGGIGLDPQEDGYQNYNNHVLPEMNEFFRCLNGGRLNADHDLIMRPTSGYLMRAYSTRVYRRRRAPIREEITFSFTEPDLTGREIFQPQQESGLEFNKISRETTISPAAWRAKVARGDWYQYAEPEPKYDRENGIYELRIRKTKCI